MQGDDHNVVVNIAKTVSYNSTPYKSINMQLLSHYKKVDNFAYDHKKWCRGIKEIHILGSRKDDSASESEILETHWGTYIHEKCLICICDYRVKNIPWLKYYRYGLDTLDIRFLDIEELDLTNQKDIRRLVVSYNPFLKTIMGYERFSGLQELMIKFTSVERIPCLDNYSMLKALEINSTKVSSIDLHVELTYLKYLNIGGTLIKDVHFLEKCPDLRILNISSLEVSDVSVVNKLSKLEVLNCNRTKITAVPPVGRLSKLRTLHISNTNINSLEDAEFPQSLRTLGLNGTQISTIPKSITSLRELRTLSLQNLHLKTLPKSILDLCLNFHFYKKGFGIGLLNTTIDDIDVSIFQQPRDIIESWLENRDVQGELKEEALNEAKVVFLGDGGAGKSLSIQRLLHDCEEQPYFDGETTPGISIQNEYYYIKDKKILIHYWDFGGQEIMHSMHRMFLTQRTLYVVFINARDNTQDERARYWLHNIKSFANQSPVIIVINQIDQNPSASVNEMALRMLYPELKYITKLSAKYYSQKDFQESLQSKIVKSIESLPIINEPFLGSWKMLKQRLQKMEEYYIDKNKYISICNECDVEDNNSIRTKLLDWFNDLGVSFCYRDNYNLSNYMILRPDWMTNAIYIILFNSITMSKNGIILHEDIYRLLGDKEKGKRVLDEVSYSAQEVTYVLGVIRRFHLSYQIDDKNEFIPMLCDRNENIISRGFYGNKNILEYHIQYQYLPINVLHRLMVDLRHDLNIEYVWLTGAIFESSQMGYRALVKVEDNSLLIYVEAQNRLFPASSYLGFIRRIVKDINMSMGLLPEEKIVYKEGDNWDEFAYEYLIDSFEHGNRSVYSSKLKKNLFIEEILNQTDGNDSRKKNQLLDDLIEACMMLQANKINWNCSEDERNTYLRDLLRSKGYVCADQTLTGKSQTGKKAGEVDIQILETSSKYMAIIEALNLKGFTDSNIKNWNNHLQKLLDNYNPIGLPVAYLVSYLECPKDVFKELIINYLKHVKSFSCGTYILQKASENRVNESFYCRVAECQYDRSGMPITVCHLFVRIGE